MANYIRGLDASSVQGGNINWQQVAAEGIAFGVIKCYQGNDGIDPDYDRNIAGMKAAGIYALAYQFVYPLPTDPAHPNRDPISQAQLHFTAAKGVRGCCDLEWPEEKDWLAWKIDAAFIRQWTLAYLAEYSRLDGRQMVIYTYPDFAKSVGLTEDFAQYPLWIASYEPTPDIPFPWTDWVLWQTTGGGGKMPSGAPVDTDVAKDLSLWNAAPTTVVEPPLPPITQPAPVVAPSTPQAPVVSSTPSQDMWGSILNFFKHMF